MTSNYPSIQQQLGSPSDVPKFLASLKTLLGDDAPNYLIWASQQATAAAQKAATPPTAAAIVQAVQSTDFTNVDSIDLLSSISCAARAPDIPLFVSPKLCFSVRPSIATLDTDPTPFDPLADPPDVDAATVPPDTSHPYLIALTPTARPPTATTPPPLRIAYQLGNLLYTTTAVPSNPSPTPDDWIDTDYVVVINALDHSLWAVHNARPFDSLGQRPYPYPKDPSADPPSTGSTFPGLPDETLFDTALLLASTIGWDPTGATTPDVLASIVATRGMYGLAATYAQPAELLAAGLKVVDPDSAPAPAGGAASGSGSAAAAAPAA